MNDIEDPPEPLTATLVNNPVLSEVEIIEYCDNNESSPSPSPSPSTVNIWRKNYYANIMCFILGFIFATTIKFN